MVKFCQGVFSYSTFQVKHKRLSTRTTLYFMFWHCPLDVTLSYKRTLLCELQYNQVISYPNLGN